MENVILLGIASSLRQAGQHFPPPAPDKKPSPPQKKIFLSTPSTSPIFNIEKKIFKIMKKSCRKACTVKLQRLPLLPYRQFELNDKRSPFEKKYIL
jgi:hypothetical protein